MKPAGKIPSFWALVIKIFIFQFIFFSILRIAFFLFTLGEQALAKNLVLQAFRIGLEFDMVVTCYLLIPVSLLIFIHSVFFRKNTVFLKVIYFFCLAVIFIFDFIYAADIPYYLQFGNHLNRQALIWTSSPGFVLGMIFGTISYWGYILLFGIAAYISYRFNKQVFTSYTVSLPDENRSPLKHTISFLVLAVLLIIGARGRLSPKSTTHEGIAVISENPYINNLGLNPNFTFIRSVLSGQGSVYEIPATINRQIAFTRNYLNCKGPFEEDISRKEAYLGAEKNYNVVVVIMESMCLFKMGYYNGKNLTPEFNNIIRESAFFDKFFSSGIHTYNGLFSTSSGYPAILDEHSLMRYNKKAFATLPNILGKENYDSYFFTTHDPHFDNMEGFYRFNGFQNIYSQYDMPSEKAISSLGVPDHVLFDKFIDVVNDRKTQKPFVSYIMTASDHGPWAVPDDIPFKPTEADEKDRATQYADWALGYFMKKVKQQSWYKNTIFLFLGDHGLSMGHTYEMPLSYHHIPLVVHHPETIKPDTIHHLGYQPDVIATAMGILNKSFRNESFGIDLFKESHPFVLFTADDKIGCVDTNGFYYYELLNTGIKRLRKYEQLDSVNYYNKKRSYADSLAKGARSILETAKYFIHKNHYND